MLRTTANVHKLAQTETKTNRSTAPITIKSISKQFYAEPLVDFNIILSRSIQKPKPKFCVGKRKAKNTGPVTISAASSSLSLVAKPGYGHL